MWIGSELPLNVEHRDTIKGFIPGKDRKEGERAKMKKVRQKERERVLLAAATSSPTLSTLFMCVYSYPALTGW
jgi:hypothetical protein